MLGGASTLASAAAASRSSGRMPRRLLPFMRTSGAATDSAHLYALFDTSLYSSGVYLPEDYTFCTRWRALGGEIWVDTRSKFKHVGRYVFAGDYSAVRTV